jgi:hypothetical protein
MAKEVKAFWEFGWNIVRAVPIAYRWHLEGQLGKTYGYIGSAPFFYFSDNHEEVKIEKIKKFNNTLGLFEARNKNFDPVENWSEKIGSFHGILPWTPPPFKEHYKNDEFKFEKPTLVISNKHSAVKRSGLNCRSFFNEEFLDRLFSLLENDYQIIYLRPDYVGNEAHRFGYSDPDLGGDNIEQKLLPLGDYSVVDDHPLVISFKNLLAENEKYSYNELQLKVFANCERFISVVGGASFLASYFGGTNLIFNENHELNRDSGRGLYSTDSWLKKLSGARIYGLESYDEIIRNVEKLYCRF